METIALPVNQTSSQSEPIKNSTIKSHKVDKIEDGWTTPRRASKMKNKKIRVEDIITNLTKKVSQVAQLKTTASKPNEFSSPSEVQTKVDSVTLNEQNLKNNERKDFCTPGNNANVHGNTEQLTMKGTSVKLDNKVVQHSSKFDDISRIKNRVDNDTASFVSMCRIRDEPPELEDKFQQPVVKLNEKKTDAPKNAVKNFQTVDKNVQPNKNVPVQKQIILPTSPPKVGVKAPIVLNKLPPGFIIKGDLSSQQFTNIQTTSKSTQPKLLLITKAGGPFYLTQNLNVSNNQLQLKPLNACTVSSSKKEGSGTKLSLPPKTKTDTPLITLQYNLPYPNNNCKVVSNPQNTCVKIPGLDSVVTTESVCRNKPREMVVNFAGNQTAHVTTVVDETSIIPENTQVRLVPASFVLTPTSTSASVISNPKIDKCVGQTPKKNVKKRVLGDQKTKGLKGKTLSSQISHRKTTYDEKIELLNSKMSESTNTLSGSIDNSLRSTETTNGICSTSKDVRVSSRKRQQTEKAKLLEKVTKRRRKSEDKSFEKEGKHVSPSSKTFNSSKQEQNSNFKDNHDKSSLLKKAKTGTDIMDDDNSGIETKEETVDDPDLLTRDPALLTREERALQRALMMFKELEEKQTRKESVCESDKSNNESNNQAKKSCDTQRKRKVSVGVDEEDVPLKIRKQQRRKLVAENCIPCTKKEKELIKNEVAVEKHDIENKTDGLKNKKKEKNLDLTKSPEETEVSKKKIVKKKVLTKKLETKSDGEKETPPPVKSKHIESSPPVKNNHHETPPPVKSNHCIKIVKNSPKQAKPQPKQSASGERHRVKTYMLVPSYNGFKDFSPVVLGSRTRSKKIEPIKPDSSSVAKEDELPASCSPKKTVKDIPLLVIETVGNKAVKQDIVAKDDEMRDLVKSSLRKQGMLKQELDEKFKDAEQFENREKRNLTVNRNTGETVLHKASRLGYDETVYHCIQQGSDSNAKDNAGWTPLHEACSRGHSDVVRVLVKYNADVNACSNDGIRPLHDAADNGCIETLRLLLSFDADPFITTYSGRTLLDCAKRPETKDYLKGCIGDLYLNDERNEVASLDYENRWEFEGSCSLLDKDSKTVEDVFSGISDVKPNNTVEFEWSDSPHLPTYNLPVVKDGIVIGRKNYVTLNDLQTALKKPRHNVIRLLKRTKIREVGLTEFQKQVAGCHFKKPIDHGDKVELVPLNWSVRSLLKIKCEQLSL
ncbi:uncharacterized protein LOC124445397 isoform X2 [Xenia sp. Carnegie-2017]|uniref:uncharacterized protein LOC124445397 isoform X2 n=1 Tax=Xenia sp. Carnegie-2017 TaxID=2897299 RepID=UPI001F04DDC3|nr:uncharacterized protein LOC124445397 isoform X2 [Xenia sp. Carnegie-2017]